MRFVLGNRLLDRAGGTEVHLLTLGDQLQQLGHEVCLYSPERGPFSDYVRDRGLDAVGALRDLPSECDVVFSQDTLVAYDLADRYPTAFHVFRVCGDVHAFQMPPQLAGIVDLVVVLSDRYERLVRASAVKVPVLRLRVPIDAMRLAPVAPIRARPRRAALLGNYLDRDAIVREAWEPQRVEVFRIGGPVQRYDLAAALADVDIVVAKSRAALDAMACGRAVYVLDVFGGDGWVTPSSYGALEADHFAGQATGRVIGVAELERDLSEYDERMGIANRDLIDQHHNARAHAIKLIEAVQAREPREPRERPSSVYRELSRLTALQWSWERMVLNLHQEIASLVSRVHTAEQRAFEAEASAERTRQEQAAARELAGALQSQLEAIRSTRAWRLARRYWHARELLRRGSGRS